jgi:hypothetical protein
MTSPFDVGPEANRPQAYDEADPRVRRPGRSPAPPGQRFETSPGLTGRNHRPARPASPALPRAESAPARPASASASASAYRSVGRHAKHAFEAESSGIASVETAPTPTGPPRQRPAPQPFDNRGPSMDGPTAFRRTQPGEAPTPRIRRPVVEAGPSEAGPSEAGPIDADLFDDAESPGRHRLPVSSAQQTVAALVSGLVYVLTGGRAGSPDARRTLDRPRFLRRRGAA